MLPWNQHHLEINQFTITQMQSVGREERRGYSLFNRDEEYKEVKQKVLEENKKDIKLRKAL